MCSSVFNWCYYDNSNNYNNGVFFYSLHQIFHVGLLQQCLQRQNEQKHIKTKEYTAYIMELYY